MRSWVGLLFAAVFLLHATNYLYFFVDDEAIPYVYAQNVLNGKGLIYSAYEGRVEGYSDFLNVWLAVIILAVVRLLGLDKLAVFGIGTATSLAAGAGLVLMTFRTLRELPRVRWPGLVTGLSFVSLSGPLAVWSCSSLEAASFACLVAILLFLLVRHACGGTLSWTAGAIAAAMILMRIDGFIYAGALVGCALLSAAPDARRALLRRVVLPAGAVFATYNAWRVWYFRELVPIPVYSKISFKILPAAHLVTKARSVNYGRAFFDMYGLVPIAVLCLGWIVLERSRLIAVCLASAALIVGYLAVVGDWMFGYRFFLPVLPLLAVLIAQSVSGVAARGRVAGWIAAAASIVWFGGVAHAFSVDYTHSQGVENWLVHPSFTYTHRFARYYSLLEDSRNYFDSGERVAYNQAGFLVFMRDLDNIDDFGICTKFYAKLPTTDVFFTDVGRYEPMTSKPVLRAGEAYLLYREPRFVIEPADLLAKANFGRFPDEILAGRYRLLFVDRARANVVYVRSTSTVEPFKTDPTRFMENLAHLSRLRSARVNGTPVAPAQFPREFPWLGEGWNRSTVTGGYRIDLEFASADVPIREVYVGELLATRPLTLVLTIRSREGWTVHRDTIDLAPEQPREILNELDRPVGAAQLTLEVAGAPGEPARLQIRDLRLQGQTPELAVYIARALRFPAR